MNPHSSHYHIVMLHGIGASPKTMYGIGGYLYIRGCTASVSYISYSTSSSSLEECITTVHKKINLKVSVDEKIIIVGQSLGGVIGWHLTRKIKQIGLLITIGSPLRGARFL